MKEITILKNKALSINVKLTEDSTSKFPYSLAVITRKGIEYKYTHDDKGFLKTESEDELKDSTILLEDFVHIEKRTFYKNLLQSKYSEIENVVILSGAGSSVGIGEGANKGRTMAGLWDGLKEDKFEFLKTLIKETKYAEINKKGEIEEKGLVKDLEALLSKAGITNIVNPNVKLNEAILVTRKFIVEKCTLNLPKNSPHVDILNKVSLRPQKYPRVKIFTLNYDTLFEQAAGKEKFTVIDGFTFSSPRVFNGKYFDYDIIETRHNRQDKKDSTIAKLFYLFKMHGSLNWKSNKKNAEIEQYDGDAIEVEDRVMIFPQDSKYEHSYEQPYFEMMARFQQTLRTENTLLITIGFSYLDKHISSVILESIKQNPSLNLMALTYPEIVYNGADAKEYQKELHRMTETQSRVTLIGETFSDFANEYPENLAHKRFDLLEELNENLKKLKSNESKL